ncbi:Gfo/Idh/MocA family protein [Streptomyces iconiensis]|uniref:Gfo/Idh/MocA family oxidoreductase n=1 Tax=Streptomyces iconiensis TaxID=1384038 RepID=A0ABT6ZPK5_9ACTN|nr:Gfo/Idh/MocA family oxidoreductase [Streptomyces iconiensis]MDJ1130985.1 Gfo/Idh/MocA family oxidoreductase [Streptomyces iconiensis]
MTRGCKGAAIVGTGMIAGVHAQAVRATGGRVRGVVASSPERGTQVAKEWELPRGYPDLEAALADDSVDMVHICTPNGLHAAQAEAALRAGKHVICEKPLATSAADAAHLAAVAEETQRLLAVPFVYRYHPLVREIRARVQAGEFGAWQLLHGSYLQDWMLDTDAAGWRTDPERGGPSRAFADIGSHWCDLVEWVAGVRFAEVSARLATTIPERPAGAAPDAPRVPVRTEDAAAVLLRTAEGVLGTLTVSQVSAGRKNRLWFELDGAEGSAVFDQEQPETVWLGTSEGATVLARDPGRGSPEQRRLSTLPAGHPQGYADCFRAFVADAYAAAGGAKPEGLPVAADGVRSARLVEAALDSSRSLAWTAVDTATGGATATATTTPATGTGTGTGTGTTVAGTDIAAAGTTATDAAATGAGPATSKEYVS